MCRGREPTDDWKNWSSNIEPQAEKLGQGCPNLPDRGMQKTENKHHSHTLDEAATL